LFDKQKCGRARLALAALLVGAGIACRGPGPEEYIHQLKSLQEAERIKAANQLIRCDADEVVPLLIEEADSGYIRVRFEVVQLLGRFKDECAVPTLVAALKDKSPRVAAAAAWALGQIGAPAALAPLLKYVRDPTEEVRQYVLGALGPCHSYEAEPALSDSAFRVVRRALRAPKPKWRVAALQSLRTYGYRDAVEDVIRMSVDPSDEVRYVAVQALGQIGQGRLAQFLARAAVVERVVDELKGQAELPAVLAQGAPLVGFGPAQDRARLGRGGQQTRCLALDHAQVGVLVDVRRKAAAELEKLALGHLADGRGEASQDVAVAVLYQVPTHPGVQEVADQHRRRVAPTGIRRYSPSAQFRFIHNVIVQQARGVQEFDNGSEHHMAAAPIVASASAQQHQQRPQPFAAAVHDVAADLLNQCHIRSKL